MHRAWSSPPSPPRPGTPKAHWPHARLDVAGRVAGRLAAEGVAVPPARLRDPPRAPRACRPRRGHATEPGRDAGPDRDWPACETISIADLADLSEPRTSLGDRPPRVRPRRPDRRRGPSPIGRDPPPARPPRLPAGLGDPRRHPRTVPGPPRPRGNPGVRPASSHRPGRDRPALPPRPARALAGRRRTRPDLVRQRPCPSSRSTSANHFAPAQGGPYARPAVESIVRYLESRGPHGVGQSSWGPTLYAFTDDPIEQRVAAPGSAPPAVRPRCRRRLLDIGKPQGAISPASPSSAS